MLTLNQRARLLNRILKDDRFDSFILTARGRSMWPFLKDGTRIRLWKIDSKRQPEIGDVAAIKYRNGLLVHRILRIRGRGDDREYFAKGDRRLAGDGWVGKDRMMGIMIRGKRYQRIMDLAAVGFSFMLWGCGKLLRWRRR